MSKAADVTNPSGKNLECDTPELGKYADACSLAIIVLAQYI